MKSKKIGTQSEIIRADMPGREAGELFVLLHHQLEIEML